MPLWQWMKVKVIPIGTKQFSSTGNWKHDKFEKQRWGDGGRVGGGGGGLKGGGWDEDSEISKHKLTFQGVFLSPIQDHWSYLNITISL